MSASTRTKNTSPASIEPWLKWKGCLPALLLLVGVLAVYWPALWGGFIWDDDTFLLENPIIKSPEGLHQFWFSAAAPDYFPMTSTTLWLEWRLWGTNAFGYHLVNVLLHAVSAVLLWHMLLRLNIPGAWLAAALFALHPVNVESVAWITERKNVLAMCFYLLSVVGYLRFEDSQRERWYWLSLGLFALALLSKTAVVMMPFVLLGIAWWRRGRVDRRDALRAVPFLAVAVALGLVTIWFQAHRAIGADAELIRTDSFGSRLATAGWAVWFYLYKALLPLNLNFIYPRWQIDPTAAASYLPGFAFAAGLLLCWRHRHTWGKAWLCGMGYFVLMLLPILGFVNVYFMRYSLVADHWQYFAIIGPLGLVAAGLIGLLKLFRRKWSEVGFTLGSAGCAALALTLGSLTWRQCGLYRNAETLWQATLRRNPGCSMAHYNLGMTYFQQGRFDEALTQYNHALRLNPSDPDALNNLGSAHLQLGQLDEAIAQFQKALTLKPNSADTHNHLGHALLQLGRLDEAILHYQQAKALQPGSAEADFNLGNVYLQQARLAEAIAHYSNALTLNPNHAAAHNNLANALAQEGRLPEAIGHYEQALTLKPDYADAHNNLGSALLQTGRANEAITQYRAALHLSPHDADILNNLAWVLATCPQSSLRNGSQAILLAEQANQLARETNPLFLRTLAAAYADAGRFPDAVDAVQRALQLATAQPNAAELFEDLRNQLQLYQAGKPFHVPE